MRCGWLWRAGSPRVMRSKSPRAGLAGVSPPAPAAVSFAEIRDRPLRPTGHGHPRSRTDTAWHERWGALLESVLGATPQEFESPILRRLRPGNTSKPVMGT